jgi:pimeloyl-ACP methyl ester carboxylesterase
MWRSSWRSGSTIASRIAPVTTTLRFDRIRLETGPRIQYVAQGDPSAEPTIFLHGFTDSWFSFSRLLPLLPARVFPAFAIDQRGHGESERPHSGYGMDAFAADVAAFLDYHHIERATIVGHCPSCFWIASSRIA